MSSHLRLLVTSVFTKNGVKKLNYNGIYRLYCNSITQREFDVPTFCDIHIDLPINVKIKPLNVHKYHNCDKLIIEVPKAYENFLECTISGANIKVTAATANGSDIECRIKAPVKANLHVNSRKNINVGYFNGDRIRLVSKYGKIFVDRFQGCNLEATTQIGDVVLNNHVQAANIAVSILEKGKISTGRLQAQKLHLKTLRGDIKVDSSYSEHSIFEIIENGDMELHNIHKTCEILMKNGHLSLTGFDGQLAAKLTNHCNADIYLSRITDQSYITMENQDSLDIESQLNLKLSDNCQEKNTFDIISRNCVLDDSLLDGKMDIEHFADMNKIVLKPDTDLVNAVLVNCMNSKVHVEAVSWQDMIKLKLKQQKTRENEVKEKYNT